MTPPTEVFEKVTGSPRHSAPTAPIPAVFNEEAFKSNLKTALLQFGALLVVEKAPAVVGNPPVPPQEAVTA